LNQKKSRKRKPLFPPWEEVFFPRLFFSFESKEKNQKKTG